MHMHMPSPTGRATHVFSSMLDVPRRLHDTFHATRAGAAPDGARASARSRGERPPGGAREESGKGPGRVRREESGKGPGRVRREESGKSPSAKR